MAEFTRSRNPNTAELSEVIGFILLLALVVSAMSIWMMYVLPINGREGEITQMNNMRDQFTDYKFTLYSLRTAQTIDNLSSITTSTPLNLGTGGGNTQGGGIFLPLLRPIASSATVSVRDTGDTFALDSSAYHGSAGKQGEFPFNITSLEYSSNNNYYIRQQYSYELGGVFLSQADGVTDRVPPLNTLQRSANNSVIVTVVPVKVSGGGTIGGIGPVRIDSRFRTLSPLNISVDAYQQNSWASISVTTADRATAAMWSSLFTGMAVQEPLDAADFTVSNTTQNSKTTAFFNITGSNPSPTWNDVTLHIQRADYYVSFDNIASGRA